MNTITVKCFGDSVEVYFKKACYQNNKNLAVSIFETTGEPFASLTVNIVPLLPNCATLDTNNLYCDVIEVLERKGLIKSLGRSVQSGFCSYPIYEFSDSFLDEWCA